MSRVVITDLVPGEAATSADVNATITSWNDGAGTADQGANNVRQEGIDRRTLSSAAQAIQAAPATFPNCIASGSTLTANALAAAYTVVSVGTNLQIGPMTDTSSSSSEMVVVRASVWLSGPGLTGATPALYELILQSSADAATWVDYDQTYQAFRNTTIGVNTPQCVATYTVVLATTPAGNRTYWRVAYRATVALNFDGGLIYIEEYAR